MLRDLAGRGLITCSDLAAAAARLAVMVEPLYASRNYAEWRLGLLERALADAGVSVEWETAGVKVSYPAADEVRQLEKRAGMLLAGLETTNRVADSWRDLALTLLRAFKAWRDLPHPHNILATATDEERREWIAARCAWWNTLAYPLWEQWKALLG